jgi:hypothetical protein
MKCQITIHTMARVKDTNSYDLAIVLFPAVLNIKCHHPFSRALKGKATQWLASVSTLCCLRHVNMSCADHILQSSVNLRVSEAKTLLLSPLGDDPLPLQHNSSPFTQNRLSHTTTCAALQ